jgi:mRNA interferase YafQ
MYSPVYTRQFERDVKRLRKRKRDLEKLKIVIRKLLAGETLSPRHRDHKLVGSFQGRRGCHIEPDWLLIWKVTPESIIVERTGSHSDLFR